ncbi:MAG: hypothetical protein M5U09_01025 [Gammaproteobacteria bacterium]|nr:hypothetical protein [Gammaproteobacteria bacterium]
MWPICHFCLWWNRFIGGDAGVSPTRTNGVSSERKETKRNGGGGEWGLGYLLGIPLRTWMPRAGIKAMCDRRLVWLVRHATRTMPFYRELLERHDVDPASIGGMDDLQRLPLLSREMLRDARDRARRATFRRSAESW